MPQITVVIEFPALFLLVATAWMLNEFLYTLRCHFEMTAEHEAVRMAQTAVQL